MMSAEGVLDILVDPRQPSWFLYAALLALVLFTSSELNVPVYVFEGYTQGI